MTWYHPALAKRTIDAGDREIDHLVNVLEKIEYASRKDSLSETERLQSVRTLVCAELSRLRRPVGGSGDRGSRDLSKSTTD